jgi:hypothetical protein
MALILLLGGDTEAGLTRKVHFKQKTHPKNLNKNLF